MIDTIYIETEVADHPRTTSIIARYPKARVIECANHQAIFNRRQQNYQLKTPYRESLPHKRSECFGYGTTHVIFEPLDFMARLTALVPKPRVNLTRFVRIIPDTHPLRGPAKVVQIRSMRNCHGVFAPNSKHRALVTPSKRSKNTHRQINGDERSPVERHAAMTWAHQK